MGTSRHQGSNGGSEADNFFFNSADESPTGFLTRDTINDFSHAQGDRINLLLVDAVAATSGDDAFLFLGKDALTDAPGQISYGFEGNTTVVHLETAGAGFNTPEMEIQLLGNIDLVASDFVL